MPIVNCPNCGKGTEYHGNEFRPSCSERCKLLDFGAWADGKYSVAVETQSMSDQDIDEIERALERKNDEPARENED